jgi:hypothetical protein
VKGLSEARKAAVDLAGERLLGEIGPISAASWSPKRVDRNGLRPIRQGDRKHLVVRTKDYVILLQQCLNLNSTGQAAN